jgi:hypothetical protein
MGTLPESDLAILKEHLAALRANIVETLLVP